MKNAYTNSEICSLIQFEYSILGIPFSWREFNHQVNWTRYSRPRLIKTIQRINTTHCVYFTDEAIDRMARIIDLANKKYY
jgi:hypothetical protein